MGYFMKHNDILIGSMLDQLNLRFAPPQGKEKTYGGIEEMAALQKEFKIFKTGRPLSVSVAVLNLAAYNNDAKNHWHELLEHLSDHGSNQGKLNGDQAIVAALVKNLKAPQPMPVFFTSHDMRDGGDSEKVLITPKGRPVFYIERDYLVISLPMKPWNDKAKPAKARPKKK
ncbi:hypothetical protein [Caenimonas aquaedulcis]|uniref:Uncharacterized protein n=1 Tax=Caenimonas aquaedulcis TaxID=2793270 RepID=A0A931H4N9_9BURK|nr:hypothetical protein [Caenimonas aquaedulcis]MBG9388511.1 hypothetical protein [Caenimonas aquaedulcis]